MPEKTGVLICLECGWEQTPPFAAGDCCVCGGVFVEMRQHLQRLTVERDNLRRLLFGDGQDQPVEWVAAILSEFREHPSQDDPASFWMCVSKVEDFVREARLLAAHP